MDPEILSIPGYPGQSQVVPPGLSQVLFRENTHIPQYLVSRDTLDVPGLSQVLVRKNTHILQYLVSWETRDDPELSQSGIENKQYSCSNIGDTL